MKRTTSRTSRPLSLPSGLEDRGSAIRARTRRADDKGCRQEVSETFRYDADVPATDRHSRASAVARAEAWVAEQRRALRLDRAKVGDRLRDVTLGDWLRRYRTEIDEKPPGLAGGQVAAVRTHIHHKGAKKEANVLLGWEARFPKLCAMPPEDVMPQHIRSAMADLALQYKLKASTIGRWVAVLSAVFTAAAEEWQFAIANPVHRLPRPQTDNNRTRLVEDDELKRILGALPDASPITRAAVEFLRWTAARRSEATNLDWSDVDWSQTIVEATFRETKDPRGRVRQRTIPLSPEAEAVLQTLFDGDPPSKGRVFPIHPDTITTAWERGCERANVVNARVHDLRHTRLTEVTALLPLLDAQRISGHLDLRMLQRYYHPKAQEIGKKWLEAHSKSRPVSNLSQLTPQQQAVKAAAEAMLRSQGIDPALLGRTLPEGVGKKKAK